MVESFKRKQAERDENEPRKDYAEFSGLQIPAAASRNSRASPFNSLNQLRSAAEELLERRKGPESESKPESRNSCYIQQSLQGDSIGSLGGRSSESKKKAPDVIFKVNFTLMNGKKAAISVKKKDNLYRLAHNFVVTHKLGEEMLSKIWETLQETYKVSL